MIALPVAMVPPEMKAPPAPVPGGQTVGTFGDHLAATTLNQSGSNATTTTSTSNAAPAGSTVVPWRKLVLKSFAGDNQVAGATVNSSTLANAPLLPSSLAGFSLVTGATSGNNPANSNAPLTGAATIGNGLLSSTALGTRSVPTTAALGTAANIAGATPSANQFSTSLANAAQSPLASTNAPANQAGIPSKASPASVLNLPANLAGQGQVSPQAAPNTQAPQSTAATNTFGNQPSNGAASTPSAAPSAPTVPTIAGNGANSLPLPQTTTVPTGVSQAAAAGNATNSGTAQAASTSGTNQLAPGAADLNARIVAGAATLAAQPTTASNAVAAQLLQPHNTSVATTPTTTADAVPGSKAPSSIGIATPANGAPTNGTIAAPNAATAAADVRSFGAAVDRASTQAQTDTSSTDSDPSTSTASGGSTPAATDTAALAAPAASAPNSPTPAAPDAALRPGMIALPASEQVAINLKQALVNGSNEIQIQLKPASLGAIDVKLNVNHDGRLTAVISADRSDTLNLLKQDAGSLQQALQDAGFSADSGSLSFNLRSDTQGFTQNGASSGYGVNQATGLAEDAPAKLAAYAPRLHNGTIDIQA